MSSELLDIVNEQDVVIDQQLRTKVHELGLWHRGVHVFLFTADGKMLIQKRSADRSSAPSLLDCSISEHVKAGESYLEAALRGMKEEMGVSGIDIKPIMKFRMNYGTNDNEISFLYEGRVDPAQVNFDPVEIESIQYLSMDEIQNMIKEQRSLFCGWFLEILHAYHHEPTPQLQLLEKYPAS